MGKKKSTEIIGDYGKHYANGYEYAMDRNRYDKPLDYDGEGTGGTIDISPCWDAWIELAKGNEKFFKDRSKEDIDNDFQLYNSGYCKGMVIGMNMR